MAIFLAFRPLRRRVGRTMMLFVALFGVATIVFGLSKNFFLSLAALGVLGAADMVSVVVRMTLEQAAAPPSMRGRVSAVKYTLVGASNELGDLESGVAAALLGTVPAVVVGGVGTVLVVAIWSVLFPSLRDVDRFRRRQEHGALTAHRVDRAGLSPRRFTLNPLPFAASPRWPRPCSSHLPRGDGDGPCIPKR